MSHNPYYTPPSNSDNPRTIIVKDDATGRITITVPSEKMRSQVAPAPSVQPTRPPPLDALNQPELQQTQPEI